MFGDVRFYESWGALARRPPDAVPRLPIEYPPGALPTFVAPVYLRKLFGYHGTYYFWLRVEILVFGAARDRRDDVGARATRCVAPPCLRRALRRRSRAGGARADRVRPLRLLAVDVRRRRRRRTPVPAAVVLACALRRRRRRRQDLSRSSSCRSRCFELWRRGALRAVADRESEPRPPCSPRPCSRSRSSRRTASPGLSTARRCGRSQVESLAPGLLAVAHSLAGVRLHVVLSGAARTT